MVLADMLSRSSPTDHHYYAGSNEDFEVRAVAVLSTFVGRAT